MDSTKHKLPTKEKIKIWLNEQIKKGYIKDQEEWLSYQFRYCFSKENIVNIDNLWTLIQGNPEFFKMVQEHFYQCMHPKKINLFYYTSSYVASLILSSGMIRTTDPMKTNDPFEFFPQGQTKIPYREIKDFQILCFSRLVTSAAMWGHYGDKHEGVCFVFSFPLLSYNCSNESHVHWRISDKKEDKKIVDCLYPVEYSNERVCIHHNGVPESFFCRKDKSWAWENEIRLICDGLESDYTDEDQKKYFKFPMEYLSGIILGAKNKDTEKFKTICEQKNLLIDFCKFSLFRYEVLNDNWNNTSTDDFPETFHHRFTKDR